MKVYYYKKGYEDPKHKLFMRASVLITDLLFFLAIFLIISYDCKKFSFTVRWTFITIILMCPPFLLIDHGHFQYNSFMLGFFFIEKLIRKKIKIKQILN